ncbi:MAG: UDP-N-acetylglucosamine 2-epimerase (non-hydrolyzing) [Burkholderiaceae bacterium]|jgi:UDP-N-acetylglucosamine 2-epimerase (non-hydrolysing)|nr:UDP-N-acetylglucosamine 2-epimerase (non-hydrolyzing) [Burkholderiaceae bacterium]
MDARTRTTGPVLCIVGARPNYMKMAPLLRAFAAEPAMPPAVLVHTGQHYDPALNDRLFADLELPVPDVNLGVGSGSHAVQTAEVMKRIEPVIDEKAPSCVVVVGDVNSTIAVGLVAVKKDIPVVHVEAGLRSFDRAMPEEINRVLTDAIAALLYTTERGAQANLAREGIAGDHVRFVGNLMIDSLHAALPKAVAPAETLRAEGADAALVAGAFGIVTLHRPSNVDTPEALGEVIDIVRAASERLPLVWPIHPRTRANLDRFGLRGRIDGARIALVGPQGYLQMVGLMRAAKLVLTDSGGVQEETTALGVPCLTLRDNTERPITVEQGTNTLVRRDRAQVLALIDDILATGGKRGRAPELWDGCTAPRIAADLARWLAARHTAQVAT